MTDNRKRTGDHYPGVDHPAVKHHQCPTCGAKRGKGCMVMSPTSSNSTFYSRGRHTRTHQTRLNVWRVTQQRKGRKS